MSKAGKMGSGAKGLSRKRYLKGTDTRVVRIMNADGGRRKFVWGVEAGGSYRHVANSDTELR
jgi:hypothetical protein